jgi:uncharacterized protein (DUF433 family)
MTAHAFTRREIAIIRRDYPNVECAAIAAALGRPKASIYCKAKQLGLRKSDAFIQAHRYSSSNQPTSRGTPARRVYGGTARGSEAKNAKLDERAVPLIRELNAAGISTRLLARGFDVTHCAIWQAVNYYTWNHVR